MNYVYLRCEIPLTSGSEGIIWMLVPQDMAICHLLSIQVKLLPFPYKEDSFHKAGHEQFFLSGRGGKAGSRSRAGRVDASWTGMDIPGDAKVR